ncbi:MAG TPA: glutamine--fructose-6-phosphate transaminase (isomerizing) [Candidatus Saccharimonadales bacterium]|nr:glutamine--fructose-6-phosphate transaminase (isomerizing) [Candidatus Saccharimonadales bacterium]
MCGIFGYVGQQDKAAELVLSGLKLLEYRGYDSWGIAVKEDNKIVVEKHIGKIGDAETVLPVSTIGIGHTRWATHGGVTVENAHPHLDCTKQIAVLHNGIIENFQELKTELQNKGHAFISETDTEVFAHLVEEYTKTLDFPSSVREAFNRLTGLNAFLVMHSVSEEIIGLKNGSPLAVGIGINELFIASDIAGIIKYTDKILFLKDHEMVILGKDVQLFSLPAGEKLTTQVETITWKIEQAQKGTYENFLIKEIHEQPLVIENAATNLDSEVQHLAELIKNAFGTFMLGCGTASYAALAGTYLFSRIAKKHINFSIGSEFEYLEDYLTPESLIIAISQSGETIDVIESINKAKEKNAKIVALVNVLGSTLYRISDEKIVLGAGPEMAVISTKAYIAMVSVLILLAFATADQLRKAKEMLTNAAENVKMILDENYLQRIDQIAQSISKKDHIYILGRGISYAVALEAALKIKETSYVHAEGFAGGEMKHGVIALIEKDTPCIIFAPNDETYDEIISNAAEVKARGAYVIGIGPKNSQVFNEWFETADVQEATLIPQIVISQLLAYYLAKARGLKDIDKPRNLAKSVTVK